MQPTAIMATFDLIFVYTPALASSSASDWTANVPAVMTTTSEYVGTAQHP